MKEANDLKVQLIPIDQVTVINPRGRGQNKFKQIVDSIDKLGLKKPIRVCKKESRGGGVHYDLVCGQGRLEAYQALGQTMVPAVVVEINRKDLLLQSLVENLARKRYTAVELAKQISLLKDRGNGYDAIARKTNLDVTYVRGIIRLIDKGEIQLLRAVEAGSIPITVAITIASSDDAAVQRALAEAYENKSLRGKELLKARKLIEYRRNHGKHGIAQKRKNTAISSDELLKALAQEMTKQRHLVGKAKLCETRLTFAISATKTFFADDHFVTLLRAEGLDTLPTYLHEQISRKQASNG